MYSVDEWPRFLAGSGDRRQVGEESLDLLFGGELGIDDESSHAGLHEHESIWAGPTSDVSVRFQSGPAMAAAFVQPVDVGHLLIRGDAIMLGQSNDVKTCGS